MSLADFEMHLTDPAPAFRCFDCADRKKELKLLTPITNTRSPAASAESLRELETLLGTQFDDVQRFYELHDGLELYADTRSDAVGLAFFPITVWSDLSRRMRGQFTAMGFEESHDPDGLLRGIAFGVVCHSSNYFTFQTTGPHAGTIFYIDHDDWQDQPIAESFADFLALILRDPADFLFKVGCYTRYSDGETDTQWIPKEYIPDAAQNGI
ncbi:MAG: hypothetical protein COA78_33285 [Blastopirellula sp.]|nr:MAG: hypothetical protein COA78_33285 [Blastopirellula sp.]